MSDHVFVTNLCIKGRHGVLEEEQKLGQNFFLDIDCDVGVADYADRDDYSDAVCYDALCRIAHGVSDSGPFKLIETLAARIAQEILSRHGRVASVRVRVRKPAAPVAAIVDHAGVEIMRARHA